MNVPFGLFSKTALFLVNVVSVLIGAYFSAELYYPGGGAFAMDIIHLKSRTTKARATCRVTSLLLPSSLD
jgi:hypothetical protein